jgi:hypothetical protein
VADVIKIALNRRANIIAEQARLVEELAEVEEFLRMSKILSEYQDSLRDDSEAAGGMFRVPIAGLSFTRDPRLAGGTADMEMDGSRKSAAVTGDGQTAIERELPGRPRIAPGNPSTDLPEMGRDHFEFND